MKNPKFQIFAGNNDQFYFRLRAVNGEIVLTSEGYSTKQGCQNGIASVKKNVLQDQQYKRKESKDGQFYFVLVAINGKTIGISEMYSSKQSRDKGIAVVKEAAPEAEIEDEI